MGELSGRFGRRRVLWTGPAIGLIGAASPCRIVSHAAFLGLALLTWGFFGAHSIASSWVGLRATRGQGAGGRALSVLFYYLGSSVLGSAGGLFYQRMGLERRRGADRRAAARRRCRRLAARPMFRRPNTLKA